MSQIPAILRRLRRLAALEGVEGVVDAVAGELVQDNRPYPPERAGQVYVRTEKLKRAWKVLPARRSGRTITGGIYNDRPAVGFVIGRAQAKVHKGRWADTVKRAAAGRPKVVRRVRRHLLALWRRR